jgi:hypothetical protein
LVAPRHRCHRSFAIRERIAHSGHRGTDEAAQQVAVARGMLGRHDLYRTRFSGHAVALCGAAEVGVEMRRAGVEGAAETVLLDEPLGVVAGGEVADGLADFVDGLEDAAMDDLLFQRPDSRSMTPLVSGSATKA